jgi:hypothetical protein
MPQGLTEIGLAISASVNPEVEVNKVMSNESDKRRGFATGGTVIHEL